MKNYPYKTVFALTFIAVLGYCVVRHFQAEVRRTNHGLLLAGGELGITVSLEGGTVEDLREIINKMEQGDAFALSDWSAKQRSNYYKFLNQRSTNP